jgi:hypothetical protein
MKNFDLANWRPHCRAEYAAIFYSYSRTELPDGSEQERGPGLVHRIATVEAQRDLLKR